MPSETSDAHPPGLPWDAVTLTPLGAADAALFHRWQNDPRLRDLTMGYRWPIQGAAVEDWIDGLRHKQDRAVYGIRAGAALAGMVHLYGMDFPNRACNLGIFVAEAEGFRGPDLCHIAGVLLIDYAFAGFNMHRITIGKRTSIQDGSVLHITHAGPYNPDGWPLQIGNNVTVGHRAILHGCTIGNNVLVGMGAIVMDGAIVATV